MMRVSFLIFTHTHTIERTLPRTSRAAPLDAKDLNFPSAIRRDFLLILGTCVLVFEFWYSRKSVIFLYNKYDMSEGLALEHHVQTKVSEVAPRVP